MKRGLTAVLLLALAVGIGLWGQWQLHQETDALQTMAAQLRTQAESKDYPAAEATSRRLQERWEQSARRLCLLLNHGTLGECQRAVVLLPQLCREKNKAAILRACTQLQYQLEHLVYSEELRWENIL